jgi:uncharacterized protein
MRVKSAHALLIAVLAMSLSGPGPALAQFFDLPQFNRAPPQPVRPPPPAPQPAPTLSLRRLFGLDEDERRPAAPAPQQGYQAPGGGYADPQQPSTPRARRRAEPSSNLPAMRVQPRPAPATPTAKPVKPKVEPTAIVAVFGDALAETTARGIADAFEDTPEIDVVRRIRADTGLVRTDPAEWIRTVQETVDTTPKLAAAVVMLGTNDRVPIREGETSHEPLSDRWRDLYRDRVDAVVRAFKDKGVPLVWISAPPVRNAKVSADLIALNEICRDRVQRAGGTYVDIWPGFVDDENRYADRGPDIVGQNVRLRAEGGVNFTRAGARKVAFFADAEIKRLVEAKRSGAAVATLPPANAPEPAAPAIPAAPGGSAASTGPTDQAAAPAEPQQAVLPAAPAAPSALAALPVPEKSVASPVVPLTRPETAPGGTLISSVPRLEAGPAAAVQKTFREGIAPTPRPGRADDFRWR